MYGAQRIHADLREFSGERVSRKWVTRLIRAAGLAWGEQAYGLPHHHQPPTCRLRVRPGQTPVHRR
ncbi:IS3 family transposase [Nonomuraea sp. KM90]|uniref:IS3 family transposase n=1 Tax=Nonomuraea sp. KM90 TaxID=3457428 RepID=UPI003FCE0A24